VIQIYSPTITCHLAGGLTCWNHAQMATIKYFSNQPCLLLAIINFIWQRLVLLLILGMHNTHNFYIYIYITYLFIYLLIFQFHALFLLLGLLS